MTNDKDSAVLEPCPFCGTNDRLRIYNPFDDDSETEVVTCDQCNAEGPYYGCSDSTSETEAIELWNRRDRLDDLITKAEISLLRQSTPSDALQTDALDFGNELIFACVGLRHEPIGTEATFSITWDGFPYDVIIRPALQEQSK